MVRAVLLALVLSIAPVSAQAPTAVQTLDQIDALLKQLRATLVQPAPVVTQVPSGADLTAAIKAAAPCALLQLAPGGTYGPFVASQCVSILGAPVTARGGPGMAFPKVHGLDRLLVVPKGVRGVSVQGVEFAGEGGGADLILHDGSMTLFDGLYIHGDAALGQKRGIALQGDHVVIQRSYISDIKRTGQDTQAIAGWDGPGPYTIRDNYLEASGENVFFGGSDPTTPDLVPSDILIADNTLTKPLAWQGVWLVKNLLELKNARGVVVTNNEMSYSWVSGQGGYAIALTVRNQDGHCPWCTVEHVTIRGNRIAHVNGFVNILGRDDEPGKPSGVMSDVLIVDNTVDDLNTSAFGTVDNPARVALIQGGPFGLRFEGNTVKAAGIRMSNSFLVFDQPQWKLAGFVFTGNTMPQGEYGIVGGGAGFGVPALDAYTPGYQWGGNTVIKTGAAQATIPYPVGTVLH